MIQTTMFFALGYLAGLATSSLILLGVSHFRPAIERTINQTVSLTKKKGAILEPENTEVKDWAEGLPRGERAGG